MKIDAHTQWSEVEAVAPYLSAATLEAAKKAAVRRFAGVSDLFDLKVGQFVNLTQNGEEWLENAPDGSALFHWFCEAVEDWLAELERALAPLKGKEDRRLEAGCVKMDSGEAVLQFVRAFFNCTYEEAEAMTMGDYLLARRWAFNEAKTKENAANMERRKMARR